jgi:hypothetical protein
MDAVSFVPTLSIHPDRVNFYNEVVRHEPRRFKRPEKDLCTGRVDNEKFIIVTDEFGNQRKMPISNAHNNKFSSQAARKVSKAIDYLIFMSTDKQLPATSHGKLLNFKISFITLTLSSNQIHTDNEIKKNLLNQFLIEAKKRWNVKHYVWRAEKQKNGSIHFHILTDKFIPWSELRDVWNRIQNKLGYVDRYREAMLQWHSGGFKVREELLKFWPEKNQIKAWREGQRNDWNSPNSTDVHSIRMVNDVKAYVMKYVVKDQLDHDIVGRMWGCSYDLTNIPGARVVVDNEIADEMREMVKKIKPKFYKGEHFTVVYVNPRQLCEGGALNVVKEFMKFMVSHFNYHYSLYIPPG